jgi:hypothetical protein
MASSPAKVGLPHSNADRSFSGSVSDNPKSDKDETILQLFHHYFKTHDTYMSNRSPLIIRYRLEELLPRRGLRQFVNRYLHVFKWINEEKCIFCLKGTASKQPGSASKQLPKPLPDPMPAHVYASASEYVQPPPGLEHLVTLTPKPQLQELWKRKPFQSRRKRELHAFAWRNGCASKRPGSASKQLHKPSPDPTPAHVYASASEYVKPPPGLEHLVKLTLNA